MRISHSLYEKYINETLSKISGKVIFSPILINNETFMFPLMEDYKTSLIVSLNNKCPLVYLIKNDAFFSSFENSFVKRFRKNLNRTVITNIKLDDKDNILSFDLTAVEGGTKRTFIAELIPNSPNLIVTNEGIIEEAYFKNKNRNLNFGEKYIKPNSLDQLTGDQAISDEFLFQIFNEEMVRRDHEKYGDFLKFLNTRIKSVKKKISSINNDVKNAEENLKYTEIADEIYTLDIDFKSRVSSLNINGKDIKLDSSKSVNENCQNLYKKAKKARETINHSLSNIENAKKSLEEFERILKDFEEGDEKTKDALLAAYFPVNKKGETQETILNRPWKYNLNGTYIYFGRNASQNDYLSFVMKMERDYTWLHIKDLSGSHIVICNRKPTDNEILFACELALICSHQKAGEVIYTKKKNVRRGHTLGEAIVKNQTTIKLNRIREETIEAFAKAKRCD